MDYGFMRASSSDFSKTLRSKDRVVYSYDGYTSYLLIVDEASCYIWVFPTSSKDPPLDLVSIFLWVHGHINGGSIRTDQGGELARSHAFQDMLLRDHKYILKPTGSDSPSQNSAVEIYKNKFGVKTRILLYGSGLPANYWSAALRHSVYLHNWLVHHKTKITPFEGDYRVRPDLSQLKVFGSCVCVKRAGNRAGKLNHNLFTGIFLGYSATDHNIHYIDLTSGTVKTSHHAEFDEAWYLQEQRPPGAQLLYDLGLELDTNYSEVPPDFVHETSTPITPNNLALWYPPSPLATTLPSTILEKHTM